jgi:hypothetical protein
MQKTLWKTTIEIWTDYNPAEVEIADLAQEATTGAAFCTEQRVEEIRDPAQFPITDFFSMSEDDDEAPPETTVAAQPANEAAQGRWATLLGPKSDIQVAHIVLNALPGYTVAEDSRDRRDAVAFLGDVISALRGLLPGSRWRHLKRQSTYTEVARGPLQKSGTYEFEEGMTLVCYRADADGDHYFRFAGEFDDGRFIQIG